METERWNTVCRGSNPTFNTAYHALFTALDTADHSINQTFDTPNNSVDETFNKTLDSAIDQTLNTFNKTFDTAIDQTLNEAVDSAFFRVTQSGLRSTTERQHPIQIDAQSSDDQKPFGSQRRRRTAEVDPASAGPGGYHQGRTAEALASASRYLDPKALACQALHEAEQVLPHRQRHSPLQSGNNQHTTLVQTPGDPVKQPVIKNRRPSAARFPDDDCVLVLDGP